MSAKKSGIGISEERASQLERRDKKENGSLTRGNEVAETRVMGMESGCD